MFFRDASLCFLSDIVNESGYQLRPAETVKWSMFQGVIEVRERSSLRHTGRSWGIAPLSHCFWEQPLCVKEFSPTRRVQEERMDVLDTHLCWFRGPHQPCWVALCSLIWWCAQTSKHARANSENSKAERLQRIRREHLGGMLPGFNFL